MQVTFPTLPSLTGGPATTAVSQHAHALSALPCPALPQASQTAACGPDFRLVCCISSVAPPAGVLAPAPAVSESRGDTEAWALVGAVWWTTSGSVTGREDVPLIISSASAASASASRSSPACSWDVCRWERGEVVALSSGSWLSVIVLAGVMPMFMRWVELVAEGERSPLLLLTKALEPPVLLSELLRL